MLLSGREGSNGVFARRLAGAAGQAERGEDQVRSAPHAQAADPHPRAAGSREAEAPSGPGAPPAARRSRLRALPVALVVSFVPGAGFPTSHREHRSIGMLPVDPTCADRPDVSARPSPLLVPARWKGRVGSTASTAVPRGCRSLRAVG